MTFTANVAADLNVFLNSNELADSVSWTRAVDSVSFTIAGVLIPDEPQEGDSRDGRTMEATGRLIIRTGLAFTPVSADRFTVNGMTYAVVDVEEQSSVKGIISVRWRRITKPEVSGQGYRISRP